MHSMQESSDLLCSLHGKGVKVWLENGRLRYHGPRNAMLPSDLDNLRSRKEDIVEMLGQADPSGESVLRPRPPGISVPLAPMQMRLWQWYAANEKGRGIRLCRSAVRAIGRLDVECLKKSLDVVVSRHESLRTRIVAVGGVPWQQIEEVYPYDWSVIDVSGLERASKDLEWQRLVHEFFRQRVDLSSEPLFGVRVFRLSSEEHVIVLALDHLITDGTSNRNLLTEVWTCYRQMRAGLAVELPEVPLQFADYAVWLQRTYGAWLQLHEPYWRAQLANSPRNEIPREESLVASEDPVGIPLSFSFGDRMSQKLRDLAGSQRTLVSVVVLALFVLGMSRWCRERELLINFISSARYRPELQGVIGCIADTLFLRIKLAPDDSFSAILERLKLQLSGAYEHQGCGGARDLAPSQKSEVTFNWQKIVIGPQKIGDELELFPLSCPLDLPVKFTPLFFDDGTIGATFLHRPDLLATSSVAQFGETLCELAENFATDPGRSIG